MSASSGGCGFRDSAVLLSSGRVRGQESSFKSPPTCHTCSLAAIKMKTRIRILIGLLILFLTSCGQARIDMISEHSGLKLPEEYKVIKNTTESSGFAGQDFEINVILTFKNQSLTEITKQIDSLILVNPKWTKMGRTVDYSNQLNDSESETISIDLQKGVLTFNFIHI